jgi:hypothetical protein
MLTYLAAALDFLVLAFITDGFFAEVTTVPFGRTLVQPLAAVAAGVIQEATDQLVHYFLEKRRLVFGKKKERKTPSNRLTKSIPGFDPEGSTQSHKETQKEEGKK